jgi:ferric-dicitrate binding protein FerR (iron transport regulator)
MKSLDRNSMDEQSRLVPRYVAGDLSRSERAEFEAWLIASPELAAEVEIERRLRRGMASAARRGWLNRGEPPVPAHMRIPRERRWQMAIAASALMSMGLAVGLTLPASDDDKSDRIQASKPTQLLPALVVQLSKHRGAGTLDVNLSQAKMPSELVIEPDVVVLTCENGAVELQCADGGTPQLAQYPEYDLAVVSSRGESLQWRSAAQAPSSRTQLSFRYRDVSELKPGDYEIRVRGISAEHEEVVARFALRVTEK